MCMWRTLLILSPFILEIMFSPAFLAHDCHGNQKPNGTMMNNVKNENGEKSVDSRGNKPTSRKCLTVKAPI
jgi:hypothetical protein